MLSMERNKSDVTVFFLAAPVVDASELEVADIVTKCCQIFLYYKKKL